MKVLVTGANGFLAANTIRELNSRGISVKGMVRKTSRLLSLEGTTYHKVFGDITNYEEVLNAVKGCDVVIHAAANTSQKPEDQKSNDDIIGIQNIIRVVEEQKVERLIFVSSANAFGNGTRENPGTEEHELSPVFKKSTYAIKKLKAQNMVLKAAKQKRINAIVVNPTFLIGAHDAGPSSGRSLLMYFNNKLVFYPPGGKNFVHVNDAAFAICNAIEKGKSGNCYLLAGQNLSYKEFYDKVKATSGVVKPLIFIPKALLKIIGIAGSLLNGLGFSAELTLENADILSIKNYYSGQKAVSELAMPETPLEDAIKSSFNWFLENNYLIIQNQFQNA